RRPNGCLASIRTSLGAPPPLDSGARSKGNKTRAQKRAAERRNMCCLTSEYDWRMRFSAEPRPRASPRVWSDQHGRQARSAPSPRARFLPSPLWGGSARSAGVGVVVVARVTSTNLAPPPHPPPTRGGGSRPSPRCDHPATTNGAALIRADLRGADHLAPARALLGDEGARRLRRAAERAHAHGAQVL